MAIDPVLKIVDGRLDIPSNLLQAWHLHEGSEVRVIFVAAGRILLETSHEAGATQADWRNLQGSLAHLSRSPNGGLEEDRLLESDLDVRP